MKYLFVVLVCITSVCFSQTKPIKIFISVDMEGIGGIGTSAMVSGGKDYDTGRKLMTAEVNAVMESGPGGGLERKLAELDTLAKPFLESFKESAGKNELVESFKRNFLFSEKEARIAAGVDCGTRSSDGIDWNKIREMK